MRILLLQSYIVIFKTIQSQSFVNAAFFCVCDFFCMWLLCFNSALVKKKKDFAFCACV